MNYNRSNEFIREISRNKLEKHSVSKIVKGEQVFHTEGLNNLGNKIPKLSWF